MKLCGFVLLLIKHFPAVATTLKKYPKGYIAIFVGTLAGNGTYAVATVFGDFSKTISNEK